MMMLIGSLLTDETELSLFETLYHDYRKLVKGVALGIVSNDVLAEDVTQETMLRVARFIKKFKGLEPPQRAALIVVIARNCAYSLQQEESRQHHYSSDKVRRQADLQPCESLRIAVDSLENDLREPLILRYYYGFTTTEAANLLNISPAAAYKRIQRAKGALRQMLREEDER